YDPHPELFDVTARTLVSLTDGEPLAATVLRFELATLRLLGHLPNLEQCVECAEPIEAVKRIAFSQLAGGTICSRCRPGKRHVVSISAPVLMTLRQFADETSELWRDYPMEKGTSGELRGIMNHTISHLLGQPPRMQNYLGFLASS
ncbi:MAG: DNA repair protein RecO C-terminal domain-containing protein, partial [Planctomycetales bacterium]